MKVPKYILVYNVYEFKHSPCICKTIKDKDSAGWDVKSVSQENEMFRYWFMEWNRKIHCYNNEVWWYPATKLHKLFYL